MPKIDECKYLNALRLYRRDDPTARNKINAGALSEDLHSTLFMTINE